MVGSKYIESLESGLIGALLAPTGMILLYAIVAIIDMAEGPSTVQDQGSLVFWAWALAVVPLSVVLAGVLSAGLYAKFGPSLGEKVAMYALTGVVSVISGALLLLFIAAFLSPADITSSPEDRLNLFFNGIATAFTDMTALAAMAVYVLVAVAAGLLYGVLAKRKIVDQ